MNLQTIERIVAVEKVGFLRLEFTDILGNIKSLIVPADQLEKALTGGVLFDGSSVQGYVRIEESDMLLLPDPRTFALLPPKHEIPRTARLVCDVVYPDGSPFEGCPRRVLRRTLDECCRPGDEVLIGSEIEFFLFPLDSSGQPARSPHDNGGYFDLYPSDAGEDTRRAIALALKSMGFPVEASYHENSPGQHEIALAPAAAIKAADNLVGFKVAVRHVARRKGLHATFMPKPVAGINGSGWHVKVSLARDGENLFDAAPGISGAARSFMAGLMDHARGITAVTNPLVNSYKRFVPGFAAPVYIAWSERNRSPLVKAGARIEYCAPDPSSNPYLALSLVIAAGMDGIERKLEPPPPVDRNVHAMTPEERDIFGIRSLPLTLADALDEMERDPLVRRVLGDHIYERFLEAKRIEWDIYRSQVHEWEVEQYFETC